jgi:hypothetical protein
LVNLIAALDWSNKKKDEKKRKEKESKKLTNIRTYPATFGTGFDAIRRLFFSVASIWAVVLFYTLGAGEEAEGGLTDRGTTRTGAEEVGASAPLLLLLRLRRGRRVIMPLGGLLGSLRALVVAGLVSWVDVVGRPHLHRQVAIFDKLLGKLLQTAQTSKYQQAASRQR